MYSRARILSVNVPLRTARLFLIDEGLDEEDTWDRLELLPAGQSGCREVGRPGLAIRIRLAFLPALPLGATSHHQDKSQSVYLVNRCHDGKIFLGPARGQGRSFNEELMGEARKLGGYEALLRGFCYEELPRGEGCHFIMSFVSPDLFFVMCETSIDR
jgi:hypothetical protein